MWKTWHLSRWVLLQRETSARQATPPRAAHELIDTLHLHVHVYMYMSMKSINELPTQFKHIDM